MPKQPGRIQRATDPGVGEYTIKGSEANQYTFSFTPAPPEGMDLGQVWEKISSLPKGPEQDSWRRYMGMSRDLGYFYDIDEAKRMIEIARARPVVTKSPDQMIRDAGFEFRHAIMDSGNGAIKIYGRKVKTGMFQISRSSDHVHGTFEFNRSGSWINLFRVATHMQWQNGTQHKQDLPPGMDTMGVITCLALDSLRQYEDDGHCVRKRKAK